MMTKTPKQERIEAQAQRPAIPAVLDNIADVVLNYRPKSKVKKARKRKKANRS